MNTKEKEFFEALTKQRTEIKKTLKLRAVRGMMEIVIHQYRDQAHFVYELLQNADDVHATNARFVLEKDKLIFIHNGTRHFSISNPDTEDEDSDNKKLGDINAITSVANSNKTDSSIGKFGIGFKAVFDYTTTPHIYDPNFKFKIEEEIIPVLLDSDYSQRKSDETVFIFPFNHPDKTQEEAYSNIAEKLASLSYPLLFMTNLKNIEFEVNDKLGLYGKVTTEEREIDGTLVEKLTLAHSVGDDIFEEKMWLFSRKDSLKHRYSVGYFLDENEKLKPVNEPAFCFFPTKETTNLNFVMHAPFLLTGSREGIVADDAHNTTMLNLLAQLAADSMVYLRDIGIKNNNRLIDDDIVEMIPVDSSKFSSPLDKTKVSFFPFYQRILEKFKTECLIPSNDGYVDSKNAYWASVKEIADLFTQEQLAEITENPTAKWAFPSLSRDEMQRSKDPRFTYIDSLIRTNINEDIVLNGRNRDYYFRNGVRVSLENIKGITASFIEKQSIDWLHRFYEWLSQTTHRTEIAKNKPIFLDQNGNAVAAFDEDEQLILFMPVKNISEYTVVNEVLLENEETRKFIHKVGIKQPSLRDQIYNIVLPQYENGGEIDTDPHFMMFFEYYCKCSNDEVDEFVSLIKDYEFLTFYEYNDDQAYRGSASSMYLPTPELKAYFESDKNIRFIALDEYQGLVGKEKEKQLLPFLRELGIKETVSVVERDINPYYSGRTDLPRPYSTHPLKYSETILEGCSNVLNEIVKQQSKEKSVILWNILLKTIETKCVSWYSKTLTQLLRGKCEYFYYSYKTEGFDSSDIINLRTKPWLLGNDGCFHTPSELLVSDLSQIYDCDSSSFESLANALEFIEEETAEEEDDYFLTETQKEKIDLANKLLSSGLGTEDLDELIAIKKERDARKALEATEQIGRDDDGEIKVFSNNEVENNNRELSTKNESLENRNVEEEMVHVVEAEESIASVYKEIEKERKERVNKEHSKTAEDFTESENYEDEVFIPTTESSKRIEKKLQEAAKEVEHIEREQRLTDNIARSKKYSYGWITNLIEKELLLTEQFEGKSKGIKATFLAVEKEEGSNRTLVLKNPVGGIPQDIENHNDIPMTFVFDNGDTKDVIVDAFNINSYTVRAKLKNVDQISGIILSDVREINVKLEKAGFLLEELCARYKDFKYDNAYSMLDNLTSRIDFVFGPPGTGKTTYLCKDVIIPIMNECNDKKILVLGPTNKSADVIVNKIIELSGDDQTYEDWLVRFGSTNDESIDVLPIYKDKHVDLDEYGDCTVVTTIHRFWYDFFIPKFGEGLPLREVDWDYIIIDEASMIPLVHILYPLFRKSPEKFIIAGDPFQIEPVITAEEWKGENIYTMVNLNEFKEHPNTRPHKYDVKLLTTQYRSIPCIGRVFSNLTYGGVLKHHRSEMDRKKIDFGGEKYSNISLIRYPVSKYESIYASKRLGVSAYHVYSALLAYEFAAHLTKKIENGDNDHVSIGIISPYRAQADIIEKMCRNIPKSSKASIQVGTIHGFQGDECDIVICVFNAPPGELTSSRISINKQNIINVAISRARDYLFIVTPEEGSRGFENLFTLNKLIGTVRSESAHSEKVSAVLEKNMFEDDKYLEKSTFSTAHQSVNVYERPEKKYEIRAEDNALDIQVHINATAITPKEEQSIQQNTLVEVKGVEIEPMEKEEVKPEKPAREYNSENYYMQLYLKKDVDAVFKDRKFDVIPDKGNVLAVKYTNKKYGLSGMELFRLENKTKDKRVIIYTKAGVLDAIDLGERFVFNFTKSKKEFWFAVDYDKLPGVLESFAEFEKKSQISDEELVLKLHAIRND